MLLAAAAAMAPTRLPVSATVAATLPFSVLPEPTVAATTTTTTMLAVPMLAVLPLLPAVASIIAVTTFRRARRLTLLLPAMLAVLTRFLIAAGRWFGARFGPTVLGTR